MPCLPRSAPTACWSLIAEVNQPTCASVPVHVWGHVPGPRTVRWQPIPAPFHCDWSGRVGVRRPPPKNCDADTLLGISTGTRETSQSGARSIGWPSPYYAGVDQFPGYIVIVDISGYTEFVKMHRTALVHAEQIITDLMESVLDVQGPPLVLDKLMGDAAVFYGTDDGEGIATAIAEQVLRFFDAFNSLEAVLVSCNVCICDACTQMDRLELKAILHHGELIAKQMGGSTELAGPDVILAHRLLKNRVEGDEYILMTKAFHDRAGDLEGMPPHHGQEETDLGPVDVVVFYPHASDRPIPEATWSARIRQFARIEAKGAARLMRGRSSREFLNLPAG